MFHTSRAFIAARTRSYSASSRGAEPRVSRSVSDSKRAASLRVPRMVASMNCATVGACRSAASGETEGGGEPCDDCVAPA